MSNIKRYLDDEVERLANKYGYSWEDMMNMAIAFEFDIEKLEKSLEVMV